MADVPVQPVAGASPVLDRPYEPTPEPVPLPNHDPQHFGTPDQLLLQLMGSPDLASKSWVFEQYDHMVMADTVMLPAKGDAAVVRVHGSQSGLALTTDCTPRYCKADPRLGGMQAVAEAWRNITAVGAKPLAVTNCLNFGNPERPRIMGQLVGCIEGMAEACKALDFPVVSGNVSLYNETDGRAILPTPNIGGVGLIADVEKLVGLAFDQPGLKLILIGETEGWIGGSLLWQQIMGRDDGAPPAVRLTHERRNGDLVRGLIEAGSVRACHDLADGGLAVAVAEMCLASGIGAEIIVPAEAMGEIGWLFGEDQARYLLAVDTGERARAPRAGPRGRGRCPRRRANWRRRVDARHRTRHIAGKPAVAGRRLAADLYERWLSQQASTKRGVLHADECGRDRKRHQGDAARCRGRDPGSRR